MKTTNTSQTKPNETEARFRSPFMPSSQEVHWPYSTAAGAHMGRVSDQSLASDSTHDRSFRRRVFSGN